MERSKRISRTGAWLALLLALGAAAMSLAVFARSAQAAGQSVAIQGFAFSPASVTVSVGDQVTWANSDAAPHTATADGGAFDTGNIASGGSATVTFSNAGTFSYHCTIHPQMTGTVVVQAAPGGGGGAATPTTPSGSSGGGSAATPTTSSGGSGVAGATVAPPSTGSGSYGAGSGDWAPVAMLGGGVIAALALGTALVLFRRSRA